ncbi:MAG: DUF2059 domain-containing protein [Allosphingosinicella sp.]
MNRLLAALALSAAAGSASPAAAQAQAGAVAADLDPQRLKLGREIIAIAYPPERRREMLLGATDAITAQFRSASASSGQAPDAGAERIVERFLGRVRAEGEKAIDIHAPALFDSFARGYARLFTAAELGEIRAFVGTAAGAKYVQRSPELLSDPDVAKANSAYMATILAALQPLQAEARRELDEYYGKTRRK